MQILIPHSNKRIYIKFQYHGRQCKEATPYYCEKEGKKGCICRSCKCATALLYEIKRRIRERSFVYSEYFPKSKALRLYAPDQEEIENKVFTFKQYAQLWLDLKQATIKDSTYTKYKQTLTISKPIIGPLLLSDIRSSDIRMLVKVWVDNKLSPKTIKNNMVNLSSIFNMATDDKLISENPCYKIITPKLPDTDPDPFTVDEVILILDWMKKNYPDKVLFYAIGFYTGMRPGEILGLKWSAIDFKNNRIKVMRQHTNNRQYESTKTGKNRTIDIIPQLMPYLSEQRGYTQLKSEFVFITQYDLPYIRDEDFARYYWKPCLEVLGLHYRTIYHMRHTFACIMLNNNQPPNWIAKRMLGHKDTTLLFTRYGNYWSDLTPDKESFNFLFGEIKKLKNDA